MTGPWPDSPRHDQDPRYRAGRTGSPADDGYRRGSRAGQRHRGSEHREDTGYERGHHHGDGPANGGGWDDAEWSGHASRAWHPRWDRSPERGGSGGDRYAERDGYRDRAGADAYEEAARRQARRRALAREQARAAAEAQAVAAVAAAYRPRRIVSKRVRRRRVALVGALGVVGGAFALLGQRLATLVGAGGQATTGGTGLAGGVANGTPAGAGNAAGGGTVLAKTADIPVGGAKIFAAYKVVVAQPAAGDFKAYSTVCTHAGCLLDQVKGDKILCPCHPGVFNLDGTVSSGPPPSALAAKKITVTNGEIAL